MNLATTIKQIILENKFHILPLFSIRLNNTCSCGESNCPSPGKHPLLRYNWKIVANNKPEKVEEWFSLSHKMNFGLATGRKSEKTGKYLVVVDVDTQEHPILKELSSTFHYRTGSGGWHFWFWTTTPTKNTASRLANKVDTRGQDGYVVIPPSKHVRGVYGKISQNEIQDLPEKFLKVLTTRKTSKNTKKPTGTPTRSHTNLSLSDWSSGPIELVREKMKTEIVPVGVRNIVLHRLLSSDRAKGAERSLLERNSRIYLEQFENYTDFFDEATQVVDSVMNYPAFNTSFEKVNEIYFSWLKKNKPNMKVEPEEVRALKNGDKEFFSSLRPWSGDNNTPRSSLQEITQARMRFLKEEKKLVHVSNYKPQLLAKKLTSLGFTKTRTAKANLWNVALPEKITRAR